MIARGVENEREREQGKNSGMGVNENNQRPSNRGQPLPGISNKNEEINKSFRSAF